MQHLINKNFKMREQRKEVKREKKDFPKTGHRSSKLTGSTECPSQ